MTFVLSKLIWFVIRPINLFVISVLICLGFRLIGWRKLATILFSISFFLFVAIGFTNLADFMIGSLEQRYGDNVPPEKPAGIIVLGGGLNSQLVTQNGGYELERSADRIITGFELQNKFPGIPIVYSGGSNAVFRDLVPESEIARRVAVALYGNDRGWLFEDKSRNTWENAVETRQLLEARGIDLENSSQWILVTSAFHMSRAVRCFERAGFNITPWKTDYWARKGSYPRITFNSTSQYRKFEITLKEWIGLIMYKLMGRID